MEKYPILGNLINLFCFDLSETVLKKGNLLYAALYTQVELLSNSQCMQGSRHTCRMHSHSIMFNPYL